MKQQILHLFGLGVQSLGLGSDNALFSLQFADGVARVKPLIIFRGKGKRISLKETVQYDKRVTVHFQEMVVVSLEGVCIYGEGGRALICLVYHQSSTNSE